MRYSTREYQCDSSSLPLGRSADWSPPACTPGWLISRVCTRSVIEQPFILIPEQPFILTAVFPYQFSVGCCSESITSTSMGPLRDSSLRPSCSSNAVGIDQRLGSLGE